jgi:hypothetical protein
VLVVAVLVVLAIDWEARHARPLRERIGDWLGLLGR